MSQTEQTTEPTKAEQADAPAQETDWKAEARKWEDRAKQNRDENTVLKQKLADLDSSKSELERAVERIAALEQTNQQLEQQKLLTEVAAQKGVDAALLHGATREELEANADRLIAWRGEAKKAAAPLAGLQPTSNDPNADGRNLVRELMSKE